MTQEQDLSGLGLLAAPELTRHPQPTYKMLRDSAPVMRVDGIGVLVSTWELVDEVLHNPALYSSALASGILKNDRPLIPLQVDPPEHGKFRKILDPLFAPRRMKALEASIATLVNQLVDGFIGRDEIDFAKEFSVPFPTQVFLTMLGLPLDELPALLTMKDGIIRPQELVGKPLGHPDTDAYQAATAQSIYAYFTATIEQRKRERRDDMLTWFLEAEIDGDRLTSDEILDICFLFLIAGLDTVSASLDCFFSYLAQHPDARKAIGGDQENVPFIVEELLRWETPVMAVARAAKHDTELGGCPIRRRAGAGHARFSQHRPKDDHRRGIRAVRPKSESPLWFRRRSAPLPGLTPRSGRTANRPARLARTYPRIPHQTRCRTRLHAGCSRRADLPDDPAHPSA